MPMKRDTWRGFWLMGEVEKGMKRCKKTVPETASQLQELDSQEAPAPSLTREFGFQTEAMHFCHFKLLILSYFVPIALGNQTPVTSAPSMVPRTKPVPRRHEWPRGSVHLQTTHSPFQQPASTVCCKADVTHISSVECLLLTKWGLNCYLFDRLNPT